MKLILVILHSCLGSSQYIYTYTQVFQCAVLIYLFIFIYLSFIFNGTASRVRSTYRLAFVSEKLNGKTAVVNT